MTNEQPPAITIGDKLLTLEQANAVLTAIATLLRSFDDPEFLAGNNPTQLRAAENYRKLLNEIVDMIVASSND
jgi:hypothetical protein